jgi:hypothetical protein
MSKRINVMYVKSHGRQNLSERLKAGYQANALENLEIALEWYPLEEEAWQKSRRSTESPK